MNLIACCVCLLLLNRAALAAYILEEVYSWKTINYSYPSRAAYQAAIDSGEFIPNNVYPIDVGLSPYDPQSRIFVTTPRLKAGVPCTLSTVDNLNNLAPYPDLSWHQTKDCTGITSVFRTQIDECGRLWVPDSGRVNLTTTFSLICPPKLLWFNLATDKVIDGYVFPQDPFSANTLILNIVVDVISNSCENTFAYIADCLAFHLIVFDLKNRNSWVITSNYFYPYPLAGSFNVAGVNFDNRDGIMGLALSPETRDGDRILYFHSLASFRESSVRTSLIRNKALIESEQDSVYGLFLVSDGERPSQTAASSMNDGGILFFSFVKNNSLNCWNPEVKYAGYNLIDLDRDNEAMQFVSGMKIIRNQWGVEEIWLLSCRFQRLMADNLDPQDTNFHILRAPVPDLLGSGQCMP